MASDNTGEKQKPDHLFKPGQSGNPNGRPKGSRNALGEAFLQAFIEDFTQIVDESGKQAGAEALAKVRLEDPSTYVRVAAGILPKELVVKDELSDISDEELAALVVAAREALANHQGGRVQAPDSRRKKQAGPLPTLQ